MQSRVLIMDRDPDNNLPPTINVVDNAAKLQTRLETAEMKVKSANFSGLPVGEPLGPWSGPNQGLGNESQILTKPAPPLKVS